jgi:hypothetical protein
MWRFLLGWVVLCWSCFALVLWRAWLKDKDSGEDGEC